MQVEAWNSVARQINFNLEVDQLSFRQYVAFDSPILDYGCGYGRVCKVLLEQGYNNIIGIDTSPEMIKRGNKKNPELSLIESSDTKTEFFNNQFGTIILCAVLTCVPELENKEKIIAEIKRILKPGGILHLVEFCCDSNKTFKSNFGITMHHQKPNELINILKPFEKMKCEIFETETMNGQKAKAMSYFGRLK